MPDQLKFSLLAQIEEVERELGLRETVYPRMIKQGGMRASQAEYHTARMRAVLKTLHWIRDNEVKIRHAIGAPQQGDDVKTAQ